MIRKNTEIIFEGEEQLNTDQLKGGIPLSEGETVHLHEPSGATETLTVTKKSTSISKEVIRLLM